MLKVNIVTLFPEFFDSPLKVGILGRAIKSGLLKVNFINPRDFATDKHKSVDDSPFGGGDGMLMQYEPLKKSVEFISQDSQDSKLKKSVKNKFKIIYLSPQGKKWDHKKAKSFATNPQECIFICGHYAGVDQRFINKYVDEELSVGDYVLTGGEPAMVIVLDSLSRFIKGTLGNKNSAEEDSFEYKNLLEAPQWTRPQEIPGHKIPDIMLSGHHKNIKKFRYFISIVITAIKKPELLNLSEAKKDLPEAITIAQNLSAQELKSCGISAESLQNLNKKYNFL